MTEFTSKNTPFTGLIYEFPNPTWIENLCIRSNGDILLANLSKPELYLLDPYSFPTPTPILLHSFAPSLGVLGIAEIGPDVFYVISGDYSVNTVSNTPGSYSVWSVDLTSFNSPNSEVHVEKVVDCGRAAFLNGMTKLPFSPHVLIADSSLGLVWSLNTETAAFEVCIDIPQMKIPPPPGFPLSINGVKVRDGYLYWTNSGKMLVCRVKIDVDGKKAGEVEVIARNTFGDDIAVDERGVWVAQGMLNTVALIKKTGNGTWETSVVAGSVESLTLAGGTAVAFGRKEGYERMLYLVSNGGLAGPVDGKTVGGSVVAIDTDGY